jgi:hypothetical protein
MNIGPVKWILPLSLLIFFCELNAESQTTSKLPKISLTTHIEPGVDMTSNGLRPSFTLKYYYSFEYTPDYPIEVNYFGVNLAKEVSQVPPANAYMQTYMWSRIGTLVFIIGGFGFSVCNLIYQANEGSKSQAATGQPASINATPLYVGLGFVGVGIVLHFSRHIWIHLAVNDYNKAAVQQ